MITKILAIDPGASTGYCVLWHDSSDNSAIVTDYGTIEPDITSVYQGDHLISLRDIVDSKLTSETIDEVCIENYFSSSRFAQGTDINYYYRGTLQLLCRTKHKHYEMLNISNWKTHVAGRSTPTKEQVRLYGKQPAKKIMIQQALWERWGVRFPNHQVSFKTGKPVMWKYDAVDAVGQAVYYAWLRFKCHTVKSVVHVPSDVTFKKVTKKVFQYPSV